MAMIVEATPEQMRKVVQSGEYRDATLHDFDRDKVIVRLVRQSVTILKTLR